jgi:hypothetical protein
MHQITIVISESSSSELLRYAHNLPIAIEFSAAVDLFTQNEKAPGIPEAQSSENQ